MKKWKIIQIITILILIIFIIFIIIIAVSCYTAKVSYPYQALGIDVYNWYTQFFINLQFIFYIFGIPLIVNIFLLILSIIKIKK